MNRMHFMPDLRSHAGNFSLAVLLAGLLPALRCWFPSTAVFAAVQGQGQVDLVTSSARLALDKTGVSIVSLIASYGENNSNASNSDPTSSLATPILTTSTQTIEDGTPVVSPAGVLPGMYVSNGQLPQLLRSSAMLMTEGGTTILPPPAGPNDLVTQWNTGIDAFDQSTPDKVNAHQAFQQVMGLNGDFDAQIAAPTAIKSQVPGGVTQTPTLNNAISFSWALLILLAVGVIALALLPMIVTLRLSRRRRECVAFEVERVEAQRIVRAEPERQRVYLSQAQRFPGPAQVQQPSELAGMQRLCRNCRNVIQLTDKTCPNCHLPLTPGNEQSQIGNEQSQADNEQSQTGNVQSQADNVQLRNDGGIANPTSETAVFEQRVEIARYCPRCGAGAGRETVACARCGLMLPSIEKTSLVTPIVTPVTEEGAVSRVLPGGLAQDEVGGHEPDRVALEQRLRNLWNQVGQ